MRPRFASATALAAMLVVGMATQAQAQSIDPATYSATMAVGQTITINKTITLGPAGANLVDIFFLADNTGSMGSVIGSAKSGAGAILNNVPSGASYQFGVGEYNSDPCEFINRGDGLSICSPAAPRLLATGPAYWQNQTLTSDPTLVQNAINTWNASGGGDTPEANFYALQQVANNASWRTGSQRLVIWFGDAKSHTSTTSQAQAIAALEAAGATVIAFNSGGPTTGINDGGQAAAVVAATGGTLTHGFTGLTGTGFADKVNAEISLATSTLDLTFGHNAGSGLSISFECTDPLGCTNVGAGESRTFDVHITADAVGTYDFSVFARGVSAEELDHIVVVDTVVPEPSTWILLGTGLLGLGIVAWRRKEDPDLA